jgi:hypothetical protein
VAVELHTISVSALHKNKWSTSAPGLFVPRGKAPGIHYRGWMGLKAGLDVLYKRNIYFWRFRSSGKWRSIRILKKKPAVEPSGLAYKFLVRDSCPYFCHDGIWGSRGTAPLILSFGSRWRWVASFTLRRLWDQLPRCLWSRRPGGPQSHSGWFGQQKIACPCWEKNHDTSVVQLTA